MTPNEQRKQELLAELAQVEQAIEETDPWTEIKRIRQKIIRFTERYARAREAWALCHYTSPKPDYAFKTAVDIARRDLETLVEDVINLEFREVRGE